jgi:hypothetical protein
MVRGPCRVCSALAGILMSRDTQCMSIRRFRFGSEGGRDGGRSDGVFLMTDYGDMFRGDDSFAPIFEAPHAPDQP